MKRRNQQNNNNNNHTAETPTNLNELSPSSLPNLAPSLTNLTHGSTDLLSSPASMLHYTPHLLNINNNKPTKV